MSIQAEGGDLEHLPEWHLLADVSGELRTLRVFSNNKLRGRIVLANYVMPFQLTAETDANNRRRKGKT